MELLFSNGWQVHLTQEGNSVLLRAIKENCHKVFSQSLSHDKLAEKLNEIKKLGEYEYMKWTVKFYEGCSYYGWDYKVTEYFDYYPTEEQIDDTCESLELYGVDYVIYDKDMKEVKSINEEHKPLINQ